MLLQGRLFICEHFICFHSNLFGYNKEKVVPLKVTILPLLEQLPPQLPRKRFS